MIPDRMIEPDTFRSNGATCSVEVRIPWYRALPASCIADVGFTVDGVRAPVESLRWTMNGQTFRLEDLVGRTDEWWFPTDSAVVTGDIAVPAGPAEHTVDVELNLFIPYIVTHHGVLRIEERDTKSMNAAQR